MTQSVLWIKSSACDSSACVEVAFTKSSACDSNACVEVGANDAQTLVRDAQGTVLALEKGGFGDMVSLLQEYIDAPKVA